MEKPHVSTRNDKKEQKNNQMDLPGIKNTIIEILVSGLNKLELRTKLKWKIKSKNLPRMEHRKMR